MEMGAAYAKDNGLESFVSEFEKGALVAQNPEAFESLDHLDESDKVSAASSRTGARTDTSTGPPASRDDPQVVAAQDPLPPDNLLFRCCCCPRSGSLVQYPEFWLTTLQMDESVINGGELCCSTRVWKRR